MYLSKRVKVVAGVSALLGVVMAGGAAFTAAGVVDNAGALQFVGGTVVQNDAGTSLSDISYTYANPTPGAGADSDTEVEAVTLTFGDGNGAGLIPTIAFTGSDSGADSTFEYLSADWLCSAIPASTPFTSSCVPTGDLSTTNTPTAGQGYALSVESITVTVPGTDPGI